MAQQQLKGTVAATMLACYALLLALQELAPKKAIKAFVAALPKEL